MALPLSEADIKTLSLTIRSFKEIESVLVFGSRAKGNALIGSDVDLALKGESVTDKTVLALVEALENLPLPYFYDIVIYRDIQNKDLVDHIDRVGIVLFQKENRDTP
jgi:predicted nucleotidyltransferase